MFAIEITIECKELSLSYATSVATIVKCAKKEFSHSLPVLVSKCDVIA